MLLGDPVVKNSPSNLGDMGSVPGWGTKIPHAVGQLTLYTTATKPTHSGAWGLPHRLQVLQLRPDTAKYITDFDVKATKALKTMNEVNVHDLELGSDFWDMTSKAQVTIVNE